MGKKSVGSSFRQGMAHKDASPSFILGLNIQHCRLYPSAFLPKSRWSSPSLIMSSPSVPSSPSSMPSTTAPVRNLHLDSRNNHTNACDRRCSKRVGDECLLQVHLLQMGHGMRYRLRAAWSHPCRRPYRRNGQERHHPQLGFPRQCRRPDAGIYLRSGGCLLLGHVVHQTLGPRFIHLLTHLRGRWRWHRNCRCLQSPMGLEQGQRHGCHLHWTGYSSHHLRRVWSHHFPAYQATRARPQESSPMGRLYRPILLPYCRYGVYALCGVQGLSQARLGQEA